MGFVIVWMGPCVDPKQQELTRSLFFALPCLVLYSRASIPSFINEGACVKNKCLRFRPSLCVCLSVLSHRRGSLVALYVFLAILWLLLGAKPPITLDSGVDLASVSISWVRTSSTSTLRLSLEWKLLPRPVDALIAQSL